MEKRTKTVTNDQAVAQHLRKIARILEKIVEKNKKQTVRPGREQYAEGYLDALTDTVSDLRSQADAFGEE